MKVEPVKIPTNPKYPRKEEVEQNDIKAAVPKRWNASKAAKLALASFVVVSLSGCKPQITVGEPMPPNFETEQTAAVYNSPIIGEVTDGEPMAPVINVAPIFVHGQGRGAFGCVMIAPPVFLTEDDALVVINEVAKEYGLKFKDNDSVYLEGVIEPTTKMYEGSQEDAPIEQNLPVAFIADFSDSLSDIAIEYVSTDDVKKWNVAEQGISAGSYDTKDAAEQLSENLKYSYSDSYGDCSIGVLYDPCANVDWIPTEEQMKNNTQEQAMKQAREAALEDLKKQVTDFFEWLKSQGII